MLRLSTTAQLMLAILLKFKGERSSECLAQIAQESMPSVLACLEELLQYGLVTKSSAYQHRYQASTTIALTKLLSNLPEQGITTALIHLEQGEILEGCTSLLNEIDGFLNQSAGAGAVAYLELLLHELSNYKPSPAQSRQFVDLVLNVAGLSMYLSKYHDPARDLCQMAHQMILQLGDRRTGAILDLVAGCLENMAAECSAPRLHELHSQCEAALQELGDASIMAQASNFLGMFHFWQGEFQEVLSAFDRAQAEPQIWQCRFQQEMFPLYTSSAAVYLGRWHQAVGILESARRTAELTQNQFKTKWWEAQLAMVLLYIDQPEEALELLDHVIAEADPETETKIYHWGMRGLAYYHYRRGAIKSAHKVMSDAMSTANKYGFKHPIYSYPWMFDLLYAFEQAKLPPIAGLEFDTELQQGLHGPNKHLQAAALRTQARCLLDASNSSNILASTPANIPANSSANIPANANSQANLTKDNTAQARQLLQESFNLFQKIGNSLEANHTEQLLLACQSPNSKSPPPSEFNPNAPEPEGDLVQICRQALDSILPWPHLNHFLNQLTHIASCELGAERAILFTRKHPGGFKSQATCNITDAELQTGYLSTHISRMQAALGSAPLLLEEKGLVSLIIPLDVQNAGNSKFGDWFLYLESSYATQVLCSISPTTQKEVADLFAKELRTALLIQHRKTTSPIVDQEHAQSSPYRDNPETLFHSSPVMRKVISYSRQIAATDAPIMILGETGVGKELLARYIHDCSGLSGNFVPVHPASIAETLFESEFFGHEKGAFTDAAKQKIGLAEMAHMGTLFIDEVGDIPTAMQVKLLRVFQDKCFLRVGGNQFINSQFRLVGATNKDLWQEVQEGRFREDLYYRMSVVPLTLPPLRERKEDIPVLVQLFLDRFSRRYHRNIPAPSPENMANLMAYAWPGNVRELKSVVERAVILHRGGQIEFILQSRPDRSAYHIPNNQGHPNLISDLPTLDELKIRYLKYILQLTNNKVSGPKGALKILGLKRSTFYTKLKQLNLN